MSGFRYAVDLDQLTDTVADLERGERAFGGLLDQLRTHVGALHLTWTGQAATAHAAAQADWERGFAAMREGLAEMREAGRVARDNYDAAVEANLHLWRSS